MNDIHQFTFRSPPNAECEKLLFGKSQYRRPNNVKPQRHIQLYVHEK